MVRSNSIRVFLMVLAMASCQLDQSVFASGIPANAAGRTIVINEAGKSIKCTVLKAWHLDDGTGAMIVECLSDGEKLTIVESGKQKSGAKVLAARIYHWGRGNTQSPDGVPVPPGFVNQQAPGTPEATAHPVVQETKKPVVLPGKDKENMPVVVEMAPAPTSPAVELPAISGKAGPSSTVTCPGSNEPLPDIQNNKETKTAGKSLRDRLRLSRESDKSSPMPVKETQVAANSSTTVTSTPYAQPVWNQVNAPAKESIAAKSTASLPDVPTQAAPAAVPMTQSVAKPDGQDLPPADWRESWGKLKDSTPAPTGKAEKKVMAKNEPVKQATTSNISDKEGKVDPLLNPEAYSKAPASEKIAQKVDVMKTDDAKVRATLQPKLADVPAPVVTKTEKPAPASDLPPDDYRPEADPVVATKAEVVPTISEKKAAPTVKPIDMPPAQKAIIPDGPQAFVIKTTAEPANSKTVMAPSGMNSMLYTTPVKEDPSLAPLPFGDKDKINQWVTILKDSIYPSQREWAADQLSACDWHKNLELVPELLKAAKGDPAATVRAGCIRCLARMNVDTVPVVLAIQKMKKDADPRVQSEAEQALSVLAPDLPIKGEKPEVKAQDETPMSKEMPAAADGDLPPGGQN
jgi:hypothetical protein